MLPVVRRDQTRRTATTSCSGRLGDHSAHPSQEVEVHYRWHALYGRKVRQLYAERRSGREIAVVESEPGVAIVLAAWMLDPATCAEMSFGPPTIDLLSLADLHRLLKAFGLRRTCSDEHSPVEEVHHAIADAPDCLQPATPSIRDVAGSADVDGYDECRSPHHRSAFCPPSVGGRRSRSRGDR